jgi:hypothetical protein
MAIKFNSKPVKLPGGGSGPLVSSGTHTPGKELGRISGPLLADNLLRSGKNLAVDTSVLYLDVTNKYVGFNTDIPAQTLNINGLTYSPEIIATTQADIAHLTFITDRVTDSYNENIIIRPDQSVDPIIQLTGIGSTDKWGFVGATLTGFADQDFTLDPTGQLVIGDNASQTDVEIDGGLSASGTITFDGDITLGNDDTDNIVFGGEVKSNIVPDDDALWDLGSSSRSWLSVYSVNLVTSSTITNTNANLTTLTAGNVRATGNTISNIVTDNDLNISLSGLTPEYVFPTFRVDTGSYINHTNNSVMTFDTTPTGYFKFGGSNGLVIPSGDSLQRPISPDVGTVRYNSTLNYVEVYANVANTSTVTLVVTDADSFTGETVLYTNNTTGFIAGDFISSSSVPGAFTAQTTILSFIGNTSVTISTPLLQDLPTGSNITVQRKWIPIIGTSPVLSEEDVTNTMDLWALIMG